MLKPMKIEVKPHDDVVQDELRKAANPSLATIELNTLDDTVQDELPKAAKPSPLAAALLKGSATRTLKTFALENSDLKNNIAFHLTDEFPDVSGTALAVACALCSSTVVQELLEAGADLRCLNAVSWSGGLFATQWQGPAVFACALAGRTDNMRTLADAKACLEGKQALINGEPRGTLLYEASLTGRSGIVKVLLEYGVSVDETTTHPDDPGLQLTPLHAAARRGLTEIALLLIRAGADIQLRSHMDEKRPSTALAMAIANGQFQLVQLLVERSADLWAVSHNNVTNFDMLFEKGDTVAIASAAAGMKQLPEKELQKLDWRQFVRLLDTQGQAGLHTLEALFVPRKICFWQHAAEVEVKSAQVKKGMANQDSINVAVGPDRSVLQESYMAAKRSQEKLDVNYCQKLSLREQHFLEKLLPQTADPSSYEQVPIDIFQCVLPALHHHPKVLHSLAHCPSELIFDHAGCQAIVLLGWANVKNLYIGQQMVHLLEAIVFAWISLNLNCEAPQGERWRYILPFLILWVLEVASEASQIVGYALIGKLRNYFTLTNAVDILTLTLSLFDVVILHLKWDGLTDSYRYTEYRFILALSAFLRWLKLLIGWRVNASVGPRMLPILVAANEILPFVSVVVFPLLGITHFYYLLRLPDDETGLGDLLLMYRLSLLNDFDLTELGGEEENHSFTAGCIRTMFVFASFGVATIMMNIFIGVLGETYCKANDTRDRLFVRTRAEVVFTYTLRLVTYHKLHGFCSQTFCPRRSVTPLTQEWDYVWYCKKSKLVPKAIFLDDDAELDAGQKRVLAEVNAVVAQTSAQAQEIANVRELIQGLKRTMQVQQKSGPIRRAKSKDVKNIPDDLDDSEEYC